MTQVCCFIMLHDSKYICRKNFLLLHSPSSLESFLQFSKPGAGSADMLLSGCRCQA